LESFNTHDTHIYILSLDLSLLIHNKQQTGEEEQPDRKIKYFSHVCSTPSPPPLTACVPLQILTVPKDFSLNPDPPEKGKVSGMKNPQDNEWLSDREREQERSERLYAERAAEQKHINANQTSAMRHPTEHTSVRPYSAKAVSSEADCSPYAGEVRPGSGVPPVTVQAYTNTMTNEVLSQILQSLHSARRKKN
jgi:hypothetical protein